MSYGTNTAHRFITHLTKPRRYKVTIPLPSRERGAFFTCSVAYSRKAKLIGMEAAKEEALKKAVKLRESNGARIWKCFWKLVRDNETYLLQLPRTLEPRIQVVGTRKDGSYRQRFVIDKYDEKGKRKPESFYFTDKSSKLAAYTKAKRRLQEINRDVMPILRFIDRVAVGTKVA